MKSKVVKAYQQTLLQDFLEVLPHLYSLNERVWVPFLI